MSDANLSRRTKVKTVFGGTDITEDIMPYFLSLTCTDNEEGEADDLQIQIQDRDGLWMENWLAEAVEAASAATLKIHAEIIRRNWHGEGKDDVFPCGEFELDSVDASGPPSVVTIKATALPFSSQIRQTRKSRAWESYRLSGIAREMAAANGMQCLYEAAADPFYKRLEQLKTSDIQFLSKLCKDAGISLKATDGLLVLFDQTIYEKREPALTLCRGGGAYSKYKLASGAADTQYASCRVRYVDPASGARIEGIAKTDDYNEDAKNNQQLEVFAKVSSVGEAKALAEKRLRLHNKFARTAAFTLPGNPALAAGVTVLLDKFGGWDGKYIVSQAKHTVKPSGYTTDIQLRRCLEGY